MKLKLMESFIIEVPNGSDTFDIIKGGMIPESKKLLKDIELKFSEDIKRAKALQKDSNKTLRLDQKIESLTDLIPLTIGAKSKEDMINKRQGLYDELYLLQDKIALDSESLQQKDARETRAKEHIQRRVRADESNKTKLAELCDSYSYTLVFETILKDIEEGKLKETKI